MEQVKKLGCHVERSSRSEVLCFDHKPKCKFVLGEISQVLLTVYQSITGWMPPRLWAARAENGDGKIWLTNFTMFAINLSFFPSWEKRLLHHCVSCDQSGCKNYLQICYGWTQKSVVGVFTFTNSSKASQASSAQHLGVRLTFRWLKVNLETKIQGRFENFIFKSLSTHGKLHID